jgi:molybdate transport system substrate-binding protein
MRLALACTVLAGVTGCKADKPTLIIAAASDLSWVLPALVKTFTANSGVEATASFGASGQFARQLKEGAPFDVFLSADERFVQDVVDAGRCEAGSRRRYARGRLVVAFADAVPAPMALAALAEPRFKHVAIAAPDHAPYGRAAMQAIVASGLKDGLETKLVFADSVAQVDQLLRTGNAEAGFLSAALVRPGVGALPVDATLFEPLEQTAVSCGKRDVPGAARFLEFLLSDETQRALQAGGLDGPGPVSAR